MIQNIQTLRVIFAFLVVTGHLQAIYILMGLVNPAHKVDGLATDGFLVISAFVMVYSSFRKPAAGLEFFGRRVARLVPFYWAITLFVAGLAVLEPNLFQSTRVTAETLVKSILFIPYIKHDTMAAPIVFVGWTMNYFVFFIAIFAAAMQLFGKRAWMVTAAVLATLAIIGTQIPPSRVILDFFTGPRLISLALGTAIAGVWSMSGAYLQRYDAKSLRSIAAMLIVLGILTRFGQQIFRPQIDERFVAPYTAAAIIVGALMLEVIGIRFTSKIRDAIAEATFSIYLTHFFITQAVVKLVTALGVRNELVLAGAATAAYIGAAVLGVVVCRLVEKPLDRAVRDTWRWVTVKRVEPGEEQPLKQRPAD